MFNTIKDSVLFILIGATLALGIVNYMQNRDVRPYMKTTEDIVRLINNSQTQNSP